MELQPVSGSTQGLAAVAAYEKVANGENYIGKFSKVVRDHIVRSAIKHVPSEVLDKREKFAFLAPPASRNGSHRGKIARHGIFDQAKPRQTIEEFLT
jgi:hypothetical protein